MGLLGKAAALLRVQVDVVNIDRRSGQGVGGEGSGYTNLGLVVLAVLPRLKVNVDAHLVVLERNERDRDTRIAAEPELEGDVQRLGGRAGAGYARDRRLGRRAGRVQIQARSTLHQHKVVRVAQHGVQHRDGTGIRGQLRPDLHPVTVLAVNALTTDLQLNLVDQAVSDVVQPAEALGASVKVNLGEYNLDVRLVHQVGVTVDDSRYALVEVRLSVEGNLNGLHGEVRVALVQNLPERDLGIARDVNILRTVADELHQTTTHIVFMLYCKKKYLGG